MANGRESKLIIHLRLKLYKLGLREALLRIEDKEIRFCSEFKLPLVCGERLLRQIK